METFILPVNYSPETTEGVAPREMNQPVGNFREVLTNKLQKGAKEGDVNSSGGPGENPAPSMMDNLILAFLTLNPSALLEENVPSSTPSLLSTKEGASTGPAGPSSTLSSLPPLPDVSGEDQAQLQNLDGRLVAVLQGGGNLPALPGSSMKDNEGREKQVSPTMEGKILSWMRGSHPTDQGENSGKEGIGLATQEGSGSARIPGKGIPSQGMNPEMSSPQISKMSSQSNSETSSVLNPGGGLDKPTFPPASGEKTLGENANNLIFPKESSPAGSALPPRTIDPRSPNVEGAKLERGEKAPLPKIDSREQTGTLNVTQRERSSLPEGSTQVPHSLSKGGDSSFLEGGGKGQEKLLWMGNEAAPLSKKEIQNHLDSYGASPEARDGIMRMAEKVGEVKGNDSPTPPRTENQTIPQQVSQRVIWLIRNNEESVRVTLDPPELGHIYMVIDRSKEDIKATLWTDNPATKATLETNQSQIQKIIETEGFKLEKFEVFVQQDTGSFQGRNREDQMDPGRGTPTPSPSIQTVSSLRSDSIPDVVSRFRSANQYVDLFV